MGVERLCSLEKAGGFGVVDAMHILVQSGNQCPVKGLAVVVTESDVRQSQKEAAKKCGKCPLCKLLPTPEDFLVF